MSGVIRGRQLQILNFSSTGYQTLTTPSFGLVPAFNQDAYVIPSIHGNYWQLHYKP